VWTCPCSSIGAAERTASVAAFARMRAECAALKKILIPDQIWPEYERWCSCDPDEALHRPIAYLAFEAGYLPTLTEPIHQFCLRDGIPHPLLTKQYRSDLVEHWMCAVDYKERFRLARIFQGRLWELVFAFWLQQDGWKVNTLEALGGAADVVATCLSGNSFAFEVKYIGKAKAMFDLEVNALRGERCIGHFSPYESVDILLSRVYKASKQLAVDGAGKIVAVILDEYVRRFQIPVSEGWINWKDPRFFCNYSNIRSILGEKHPVNWRDDMKHCASQLDQIWFFDITHGMTLRRQRIESVREPPRSASTSPGPSSRSR
jgi:hypothetical protein